MPPQTHPAEDCATCLTLVLDDAALDRLLAAVREHAALEAWQRDVATRPQASRRRRAPRYGAASSTRSRYVTIPDDVDAADVRLFAWGWLIAWTETRERLGETVTGAQVLAAMTAAQAAGIEFQRKLRRGDPL